MAWCPKCKQRSKVHIEMMAVGTLRADEDINCYPEISMEHAGPTDITWCEECNYRGVLAEFQNPNKDIPA